MKILVTGGTGFIGSHFVSVAMDAGHQINALRRKGSVPQIPLRKEPSWIEGDLETVPDDCIQGCEALVHLAAYGVTMPSAANWMECFRWNVQASLSLWLQAARLGVPRLVICGSCVEYGVSGNHFESINVDAPLLPVGAYATSKAAATIAAIGLASARELEMIVLRPFHVYGDGEPSGGFLAALRTAALAGLDFPMSAGTQVRDFIPVTDVAHAFLSAIECPSAQPGRPIIQNVGTGIPTTLLEFATRQWQALGARGRILPNALPMRPNESTRLVAKI